MARLLRAKFSDPRLAAALVATGTAELVEVNTWDDGYWGVCAGQGNNHLGRLLMALRAELLAELGPWQHGVRLAVVGSAARCFTPRTAVLARQRISLAIWRLRPGVVISGGCPKGGVDIWARDVAGVYGYTIARGDFVEHLPAHQWWAPDGYQARNAGSRPTARICFVWPPAPAVRTAAAGPPTWRNGAAGSSSASGSDRLGDRDRRSARTPTGLTACSLWAVCRGSQCSATPAPARPVRSSLARARSGTPVLRTPCGRPFRRRGPRHCPPGDRQDPPARQRGVCMDAAHTIVATPVGTLLVWSHGADELLACTLSADDKAS